MTADPPDKPRASRVRAVLRTLYAILRYRWTGWIAFGLTLLVYLVGDGKGAVGGGLMVFFGLVMAVSWSIEGHTRRDLASLLHDATEKGVRLRAAIVIGGIGQSEHARMLVEVSGPLPDLASASDELDAELVRARAAGWSIRAGMWRFDKRIWPWTNRSTIAAEPGRGERLASLVRARLPPS